MKIKSKWMIGFDTPATTHTKMRENVSLGIVFKMEKDNGENGIIHFNVSSENQFVWKVDTLKHS